MKSKRIESKNPWTALDTMIKAESEPTGEEWFSVHQFSQRYNMSIQGSHNKLNRMVQRGLLEKWYGYSASVHRYTCKYRLVDAKKP